MFTSLQKPLIMFSLIFSANLVLACDSHRDFLKTPTPDASLYEMSYNPFLASACLKYAGEHAAYLVVNTAAAPQAGVLLAPISSKAGAATQSSSKDRPDPSNA